jgi:hypothetical protein
MDQYLHSDIKTDIYVVVNPNSGYYSDSTYKGILTTLRKYLNSYILTSGSYLHNNDSTNRSISDNTIPKTKIYRMIEFKTMYINHALQVFSKMSLKDISNTHLIIIIGGDGIIHEVVNGLFINENNKDWLNIFPQMCVCPLGSGNHLAKLIGTSTIDKFYESILLFTSGKAIQRSIIPTMVKNDNTTILSINTIVVGTPAIINETSSYFSGYLPQIMSPLKYEIGTMLGIFSREYFIINTINSEPNEDSVINNVIGLFIQSTPSCGNNFLVDKRVNGCETKLSYAYIKDASTLRLIYEFTKERAGYESTKLVREYDTSYKLNLIPCIDLSSPTLTIDGQNDKIQFPVTITKHDHILSFLSV